MANHVNDSTFEQEVLRTDGPVLVDFYATWCPPCKALAPTIDDLAEEFGGRAAVVKVNVEEAPETALANRVSSVPTLVLFDNGEAVNRWVGLQPKQALAEALEARLAPVGR